jgi:hypothetical protein
LPDYNHRWLWVPAFAGTTNFFDFAIVAALALIREIALD